VRSDDGFNGEVMTLEAMTVLGPVDVNELGLTLPHEHIMFNSSVWVVEPADPWKIEISQRPVTMASVGELRRDPMICRDNLVLEDEDVALREIGMFKDAGGSTIVDVSSVGLRGDVERIRRLSERSGLNIIVATGCYVADSYPPHIAGQDIDQLTEWMISELTVGIDGTGIRAGIIGELGVSEGGANPQEEKVLRAAAAAQVQTGAPITIHNAIPHERQGFRVLRTLEAGGADLSRVIMGHMTQSVPDSAYHRALADTGAALEFDRFGAELYNDSWGGKNYCEQRDAEVVVEIADLIRKGYGDRILMSHDVGFKVQLSSYGGLGYAHIPRRVVRYLTNLEVSDEDIRQMTVLNPARLLGNDRLAAETETAVAQAGAA
jgi:phosphotriesterase-related protein